VPQLPLVECKEQRREGWIEGWFRVRFSVVRFCARSLGVSDGAARLGALEGDVAIGHGRLDVSWGGDHC
jgi:hypothetical protein